MTTLADLFLQSLPSLLMTCRTQSIGPLYLDGILDAALPWACSLHFTSSTGATTSEFANPAYAPYFDKFQR